MSIVLDVVRWAAPMTLAGWATVPGRDDLWHAFADDDGTARPVRSRCDRATLLATGPDNLERVPRGRPCVPCLLAATEELPHVGRMGPSS